MLKGKPHWTLPWSIQIIYSIGECLSKNIVCIILPCVWYITINLKKKKNAAIFIAIFKNCFIFLGPFVIVCALRKITDFLFVSMEMVQRKTHNCLLFHNYNYNYNYSLFVSFESIKMNKMKRVKKINSKTSEISVLCE